MGELLLELLSEEIPARMQRRAIEDLIDLIRRKLATAQIPPEKLAGYVTPRRLTVIGDGIPEHQPEHLEERRGPRVGAPRAALDGFVRVSGLDSIEQCEIRDIGRGEFYFAVSRRPGRDAAEVLSELLRAAIDELAWPKSMRFPAASFRWVRPLVSVVCLFDGKIVPLNLGRIPVGRATRGHRFMSEGEIAVDNAADYFDRLEAAYVILDQDRRRAVIAADLDRLTAAKGLVIKPDPGLLDEVTGLVEFPVVLMGAIDDDGIVLPPEVLATAMRTHQRYFSCLYPDRTPAPHFLFAANNLSADDGKTVVAGNERVLRARLTDARFFWDQDRRVPLDTRVAALAERVFHAKLGNLRDKVARMERLAEFLVPFVPGTDVGRAQRAVRLAKADLSTAMVGEFPELQGVMGRYYALSDGEDAAVADAIADHYRPLGPNDTCPTAPISIVAALADKIDSLVAFFAIGAKPTGSRDPFALRRAALGTIRVILENGLRLPLTSTFERAYSALVPGFPDPTEELTTFVADRLKLHLRERGTPPNLIAAVFATLGDAGAVDDFERLFGRMMALNAFLVSEDGVNLLTAYRRASNIVAIEERKDNRRYDRDVDPALLRQPEEFALAADLALAADGAQRLLVRGEFDAAMGQLATLRRPVDEFFDKVTVNTDDRALRENRLCLLSRIRAVMNQVADFSQIEG